MNHYEVGSFFIFLFILLFLAKFLGEITRKFFKSGLVGEIFAGIILGPTILGHFSPDIYSIYNNNPITKSFFDIFNHIAVVMLLLIAGMESDIKSILKQKVILWAAPLKLFIAVISSFLIFGLFIDINYNSYNKYLFIISLGFALSITAIPVLVRILSEINCYRTDFGMSLIGSAMFIDIIVWILFSVILIFDNTKTSSGFLNIIFKIIFIISFIIVVITFIRIVIDKILPFIQSKFSWPDGIIAFVLSLSFFFAGLSEIMGTHAIIGAFLAGLIINDSSHFRERVQSKIESIVDAFFAPIYFASLGLQINFLSDFNWKITLIFLVIRMLVSLVSGFVSYRRFGNSVNESIAFGFGLNTVGATDIIFFSVLFSIGVVDNIVYKSYIIYVMIVVIISPFLIRRFLKIKYYYRFHNYLNNNMFKADLNVHDSKEAIKSLAKVIAKSTGLNEEEIASKVIEREELMPTGIGNGVAIPHARLNSIKRPVIAVGISEFGVDFGSRDGELAHLIFLILTPADDPTVQLELLADIAKTFKFFDPHKIVGIENLNQFITFVRNEL